MQARGRERPRTSKKGVERNGSVLGLNKNFASQFLRMRQLRSIEMYDPASNTIISSVSVKMRNKRNVGRDLSISRK